MLEVPLERVGGCDISVGAGLRALFRFKIQDRDSENFPLIIATLTFPTACSSSPLIPTTRVNRNRLRF